jgi:hypothetical protein
MRIVKTAPAATFCGVSRCVATALTSRTSQAQRYAVETGHSTIQAGLCGFAVVTSSRKIRSNVFRSVNSECRFFSIKTGLNEAFVIDGDTRARLIERIRTARISASRFWRGGYKEVCTPTADKYPFDIPNGWTRQKRKGIALEMV